MTRGRGRGEDGGAAGVGGGTAVWRQGMGMGNLRRDGEPEERWGPEEECQKTTGFLCNKTTTYLCPKRTTYLCQKTTSILVPVPKENPMSEDNSSILMRLISTKAKSVSTKVTRILKNAKLQQVALESKAKVNATAAIKAKAEQASKALKLPTDHI